MDVFVKLQGDYQGKGIWNENEKIKQPVIPLPQNLLKGLTFALHDLTALCGICVFYQKKFLEFDSFYKIHCKKN